MKSLQKLNNKEIEKDIKDYIKTNHKFYKTKLPELKTLSKILYEEHSLEEFYKIFNKLWNSSKELEKTLAIQTLKLYKKEFDIKTWKFIKNKLKNIKSPDLKEDILQNIIKPLSTKYPKIITN